MYKTTLSRTHLRRSAECRETITVCRCQKREVETKKSFLLSYIINVYDISFYECSVENTLPCIIRTRSNSSSIYCTNNPSKMKASYMIVTRKVCQDGMNIEFVNAGSFSFEQKINEP